MLHLRSEAGQGTVENMLVVSVLTVAILGASYAFVPVFSGGVEALGRDIARVLEAGSIGDGGAATNGVGGTRHGMDAAMAPSMSMSMGDSTTNDTTSIPNMNNQDDDPFSASNLDGMVSEFESSGGGGGGGSDDGDVSNGAVSTGTGNRRLGAPDPG